MAELTPQQVDLILYNLRTWRVFINVMLPKNSASVVSLPISYSRDWAAVERVAIKRATVSAVLDKVEDTLAELPCEVRRIVRMRYDQRMTYRQISYALNRQYRRRHPDRRPPHSKTTVWRQVDHVRVNVAQRLGSVDPDFWRILGQAS